ncbi:MAG TPA: hypothetical protein DIU15_11725 [Deltaproteobacteria bacterium]|nr:hypothetical protein [Deltaproteobacteria bacterium]HCP46707.1 hypothetical protein [Deltaproteobacteria bacterium]
MKLLFCRLQPTSGSRHGQRGSALAVEVLLVAVAAAFFLALFLRSYQDVPIPLALTLDASTEGLEERWSGVYVGPEKIGYAVTRTAPRRDGGRSLSERTQLRLTLLGEPNEITLANDLNVGPDGRVESLVAQVRTTVQGLPVTLRAEGRANGRGMTLQLFQAGNSLTTLDLDDVPATPASLYPSLVESGELQVGKTLSVPYFNPLSLSRAEAVITVLDQERAVDPAGQTVDAWRLKVETGSQAMSALVAVDGRRLVEEELEGGLGMRVLLENREDALNRGWPEDEAQSVDLIALSSIPLSGRLPGGGRGLRELQLSIHGPEAVDQLLQAAHGNQWDADKALLRVAVPDPQDSPSYPLPETGRALRPWLRSTTFLPADDPKLKTTAGRIIGAELDARDAARKLNQWVYRNVKKVPVAGFPQATEVLKSLRGDCNEHTTLYTTLARAVGLPTKMAAGIVYSESIFEDGAFYYHAWPEVWLGDRWLPVDPTFGQFPADATHIKLVEGELDRQLELMGVIGRLKVAVADSPDSAPASSEQGP